MGKFAAQPPTASEMAAHVVAGVIAPPYAHFSPRELSPDGEISWRLASAVGQVHWKFRTRVIVQASAAYVRDRLPISVDVEPLAGDRCAFEPGSDYPGMLALYLGMIDADFEVVDSPELVESLAKILGRYQRAVDASVTSSAAAQSDKATSMR